MAHLTAARIRVLAKGHEDDLRHELAADLLPPAIEAIRAGLKPVCTTCGKGGQRWAVRSVLEICKLVGAQPQVLLQWFQQAGVRDQDEGLRLIEQGKKMEQLKDAGVGPRESFESAMDLLTLAVQEDPSLRQEALTRLGVAA